MQGSVDAYNAVAAMPDEVPIVKYPRTPGYRPGPEENPRNAWYRKSTVKGASTGQAERQGRCAEGQHHAGRRADDERFLDARRLSFRISTRPSSRGCWTPARKLPARFIASCFACPAAATPIRPDRCTTRTRWDIPPAGRPPAAPSWSRSAKSTWRSAATRAARSGCLSSFSGIYGMKPTWGLVPYTGIMPIEIFVDHTGPMTANVADNALLLEVLAGDDGYDPRIKAPEVQDYTKALGAGHQGTENRHRQGRLRAGRRRSRGERERPGGGQAARHSRRHCRGGFDSDASWWRRRSGRRSAPKA